MTSLSLNGNFLFAQMLGVKRIERVLPTGSPLTVVGEVHAASIYFLTFLGVSRNFDYKTIRMTSKENTGRRK